jgi:hypothetical protein
MFHPKFKFSTQKSPIFAFRIQFYNSKSTFFHSKFNFLHQTTQSPRFTLQLLLYYLFNSPSNNNKSVAHPQKMTTNKKRKQLLCSTKKRNKLSGFTKKTRLQAQSSVNFAPLIWPCEWSFGSFECNLMERKCSWYMRPENGVLITSRHLYW